LAAFTVSQAGAAGTITLADNSASVPATASTGSFAVTATPSDYTWTAVSNSSWIAITSGAAGTGNGNLVYAVSANPTATARTGVTRLRDKTFSISQAAATGTLTLGSASAAISPAGGTGTVSVGSTGSWGAVSNAPWTTITSGSSVHGNGAVSYAIGPNLTATERTGTITIGDKTYTVTQSPAVISPSSPTYPISVVGADYRLQILTATGGVAPQTFSITSGSLPPGLTFASPQFSGIPRLRVASVSLCR
jgi:Viral BACON domain